MKEKEEKTEEKKLTRIDMAEFLLFLSDFHKEGEQKALEINLKLVKARSVAAEVQQAEAMGLRVKYYHINGGDGVHYEIEPKGNMGFAPNGEGT